MNQVNWRDVRGNPFVQSLHPAMLFERGYTVTRRCLINGQRNGDAAQDVQVLYDETYVIAKLRKDLVENLHPENLETLQNLVSRAWQGN